MKQRDERGYFLPGNTVAVGNKGNRNPKFGNQNAIVHGLYGRVWPGLNTLLPSPDGERMIVIQNGQAIGVLQKKYWKRHKGVLRVRKDVIDVLIDQFGFRKRDFDFL